VFEDADHWKDELGKIADRLEAKTKQARWTDRTGFLIERDFVVSAYAMQKLLDSRAVSSELRKRHIPVRRYDGRRGTLSVKKLCHEIMHSVAFTFFVGETADLFDGIYVSSDRDNKRHEYLVLASDFIALCFDMGSEKRPHSGSPE
jgi:hypothetical protein